MTNIAIFASGNGSNAQRIAEFFRNDPHIRIRLILSNNPGAFVLKRAENLGIESLVFDRKTFYETGKVLLLLQKTNISMIVLAGFLWLVPANLLNAYPRRIINIHPALLPRYGGKGMYGEHVHKAVLGSGDRESGISIHYVDGRYDEGDIIFQARCPVIQGDTAEILAARVHELEYQYYPGVIRDIIRKF